MNFFAAHGYKSKNICVKKFFVCKFVFATQEWVPEVLSWARVSFDGDWYVRGHLQ